MRRVDVVDIHTASDILANYPVKMGISFDSSEESKVGYSFHGKV